MYITIYRASDSVRQMFQGSLHGASGCGPGLTGTTITGSGGRSIRHGGPRGIGETGCAAAFREKGKQPLRSGIKHAVASVAT
jgi:hypothetical protein